MSKVKRNWCNSGAARLDVVPPEIPSLRHSCVAHAVRRSGSRTSSVFLFLFFFLSMPAGILFGETPTELLEKAIYAEETVGNLDEAIKLYGQVVAQSAATKQTAAQAQYRIALCYRKQRQVDKAQNAYQRLVSDFPEAKELIAEARKVFDENVALLPVPWQDGEELYLNMKLSSGMDIGTMIYGIRSTRVDDRDAWECQTRGLVTINDSNSFSRVVCDKETFQPRSSQ